MTTATDRETVRDWVGSEPDDATVDATVLAFAGESHAPERAALRILLRRQADGGPAKWGVAGDYSEDDTDGRKWLVAQINRLRAVIGDEVSTLPTVTSVPVTGPGSPR